jgi:hypothetical protein
MIVPHLQSFPLLDSRFANMRFANMRMSAILMLHCHDCNNKTATTKP